MSYSGTACGGGETHTVGGPHDDEAGRRCAIGFNPSSHEPTDKIKAFCATAMKAVMDERDKLRKPEPVEGGTYPDAREVAAYSDAMRCFATALTHLETAQMFAVKGLHTRKNAGPRRCLSSARSRS